MDGDGLNPLRLIPISMVQISIRKSSMTRRSDTVVPGAAL